MAARSSPRPLIVAAILPLGALLLAAGLVASRVVRHSMPPRVVAASTSLQERWLPTQAVSFQSTDGIELDGWWVNGLPGHATIILCHDHGRSRSSLMTLALALREKGFGLLLFDFRGHGASGRGRSSLGLYEKRDVIGAIDWLKTQQTREPRALGIYGTGMGAHAAVLAAADHPELRVLVLDGLYPDPAWRVTRAGWGNWELGIQRFDLLPRAVYAVLHGAGPASERAEDVLHALSGRDVLLLAAAGDPRLAARVLAMYESIPDQVDADGNLAMLPATQSEGLYGDARAAHHQRVVSFFVSRLAPR
jgi:pimeloyl-ACP methyl ester carboxylesterase